MENKLENRAKTDKQKALAKAVYQLLDLSNFVKEITGKNISISDLIFTDETGKTEINLNFIDGLFKDL